MATAIIQIENRRDILSVFSIHGKSGFECTALRNDYGNLVCRITFVDSPQNTYELPLSDLVFFAGFLPPKNSKVYAEFAVDAE